MVKNIIVLLLLIISPWTISSQKSAVDMKEFYQAAYQKGYTDLDLASIIITDEYTSNDIHHIYINQAINGIPIYHKSSSLHRNDDSKVYLSEINFIHGLERITVIEKSILDYREAMSQLAVEKDYDKTVMDNWNGKIVDINKLNIIPGITNERTKIEQVFFPVNKQKLVLSWRIIIDEVVSGEWKEYIVDAENGRILKEVNLTVSCNVNHHDCDGNHSHKTKRKLSGEGAYRFVPAPQKINVNDSYNVIPFPFHDPYVSGREIEVSPWDYGSASPNGWHNADGNSYTATRGNNVDAYEDSDASNNPTGGDAARAEGGVNLMFDFPWSSTGSPSNYKEAAVTNLFYWNNIIHDVLYNYGFDEASGNFQVENYSVNGDETDDVRAEAQDGSGSCNANFSTPPDGSRPRMQMYNCGGHDSDFDNGVIIHEYGHGVSNRLTAGPSEASCLHNQEQMGEGWSDYLAIVMTMLPGDQGEDSIAIGNWLFSYGPNGDGIRPFPYSTDTSVNPMTYETISSVSIPHGVGSVWATILWDVTWGLIDEYGWDEDVYYGEGGNNIALQLVMEGMKIQPCSPGFVDGRDAILAADELLYSGIHKALLWEKFADRGLGFSANQGSSYIVGDETEAFDFPPDHSISMEKNADKYEIVKGDSVTFTLDILNPSDSLISDIQLYDPLADSIYFISGTMGAFLENDTVKWPLFDLLSGQSMQYEFSVKIDTSINTDIPDILDDMEGTTSLWSVDSYGSTDWVIQSSTSNSGTQSWFSNDAGSTGIANLDFAVPVGISSLSILSFFHSYDTEAEWDGGLVFISTDGGDSWVDLGPYFIQNGYNDIIYNFKPGFSGNSNGFIESRVDLNSFVGNEVLIRFQMNCDQFVGGNGWFIDDVSINNLLRYIPNTAYLTDSVIFASDRLDNPIYINHELDINLIVDNKCAGSPIISITPIVENASGPFTYSWNSGSTDQTEYAHYGGLFIVTVTDGISTGIDSVYVLDNNFIVNSTTDYDSLSLRNIIMNTCPSDTVLFHSSLMNDTIQLEEQLVLHKDITIIGLGKNNLFINSNSIDRAFWVKPGVNVTMKDVDIRNAQKVPFGGAIYNEGNLVLDSIKLFQNKAGLQFVPITNQGNIDIINEVDMEDE